MYSDHVITQARSFETSGQNKQPLEQRQQQMQQTQAKPACRDDVEQMIIQAGRWHSGCFLPEMESGKVNMVTSKSPKRMWPITANMSATHMTVYPTSRIHGNTCIRRPQHD